MFNFIFPKKKLVKFITSGKLTVKSNYAQLYVGIDKDLIVKSRGNLIVTTGLSVNVPKDCALIVQLNPGIMVTRGIQQRFLDIIPGGYVGKIRLHLINPTDRDYRISNRDLLAHIHLIGGGEFKECPSLNDVDPVSFRVEG